MKTEFVLLKTPQGIINFAIRKENGEVFSFSADDSAGAFKDRYVRTYLLIDKDPNGEYQDVSPELFFEKLSEFMNKER